MATLQRALLTLALQWSPALLTRLRFARSWGTCAWWRCRSGIPALRRQLQQALAEQQPLLEELALLRQAHACSHRAQLSGGYDPDGLDELITIAEALEIEHGWDALLVDQWLERLGLWDQEL